MSIEEKVPEDVPYHDSSFDILKNSPKYENLMKKIKTLNPTQQKAALQFALKSYKKALANKNSSGKTTVTKTDDGKEVITTASGTTFTTVSVPRGATPDFNTDVGKDITIIEEKDIIDVEILDAICMNSVEKFQSLLQTFKKTVTSEICAKNEKNAHPVMHWAALEDKVEILKFIVDNLPTGATLDVRNFRGETALHWACLRGHVRAVNVLLRNGADLTIADDKGYVALHHAAQFGHTKVIAQLLRFMARRNLSNIDLRDTGGRTALHWAAYKHFPDTVRFLVNKGADMYAGDFEDLTPLHWGALQGDLDVIQALLWEIKSPQKMVKYLAASDKNGQNAYQLADAKRERFNLHSAEGYRYNSVKRILKEAFVTATKSKLPKRGFGGTTRSEYAVYDESFFHPIYLSWPAVGIICGYVYFFTMVKHIYLYAPLLILVSTILFSTVWYSFLIIQVKDPGFLVVTPVDDTSRYKRFFNYLLPWMKVRGYINKSDVKTIVEEKVELLESGRSFNQQYEELFPPVAVPNPKIKTSGYYRNLYYEILDNGLTVPICTTCEIAKPLRSKHDRFSDKCICKFDHYCPWVGAPVAEKNYHEFFIFCFFIMIMVPAWLINWKIYLIHIDESKSYMHNALTGEMIPWIICTVVPIVPFLLYAAVMVFSHAYLITLNMTTNESMNRYRYGYIINEPNGNYKNSFSLGAIKNWLEFFGLIEPKVMNYKDFYHKEFRGEEDQTDRVAKAKAKIMHTRQDLANNLMPQNGHLFFGGKHHH